MVIKIEFTHLSLPDCKILKICPFKEGFKQEYAPVWGCAWNLKPFVTRYLEE